jgi:PAS domain S-box/diguanylate cyclase (GGDEF) domain
LANPSYTYVPEVRDTIAEHIRLANSTGHYIFESIHLRKDGSQFPALIDVTVYKDKQGKIIFRAATVEDISERKRTDAELRLAASVFANTHEGVMVCDREKNIIDVNPSFSRITGYAREEVIGKSPHILASTKQGSDFYEQINAALTKKDFWCGEIWNRRKNGELYAEMLSISAVRNSSGELSHYIGVFSDISHMKAHQEELDKIAHFDPLTGVPNRRLLSYRLDQSLAHSRRTDTPLAVCYLDLDFFKPINDTHGHAAGDQLLIETAERLKNILRTEDTLARLGGDEFVLLLSDLIEQQEVYRILERILQEIHQPVLIEDTSIQVSASIGVTLFPTDDSDADTLLRHADQAMYRAKQKGKNRYHFYDPDQDRKMQAHLERIKRLEAALKNQELILYYQPKVNLLTGEVFGVEALIRWQHPERGLVLPGEFLYYLYGSELEPVVGEWVIKTALNQIEQWQQANINLTVSVNIGADHLLQNNFSSRLQNLLTQHPNVAPSCLELEILETADS